MDYIVSETKHTGATDTKVKGELVLCANCKYLGESAFPQYVYTCTGDGILHPVEDDYCSRGERISYE